MRLLPSSVSTSLFFPTLVLPYGRIDRKGHGERKQGSEGDTDSALCLSRGRQRSCQALYSVPMTMSICGMATKIYSTMLSARV